MRFRVELGERSYDVTVGAGVRHELASLIRARAPRARAAAIVAPPSIAARPWFDLTSGIDQHVLELAEGESAKTPATLSDLVERLAACEMSRDDVVVAVGGGAVTDVAGFAAAVYLRGVGVVHVPTTLVAQVDAAIGGKTGVNLSAGKNLMGAFHQPLGVLCDTETLATLPDRERRSGMGEVAKCWLLNGRDAHELAAASEEEMIGLAIFLKAGIVGDDEFEGGRRALLNYGHTLAHALEAYWLPRDPDRIRHGEAVAVGIAFAARLARALGRVDADVVEGHDAVLDVLGLERGWPAGTDVTPIVDLMAHDKKAHHDLTFVLDGPLGFEVVAGVAPSTVASVLESMRGAK